MTARAALADVNATTRISLSQLPQALPGGYLRVEVLVIGKHYQVVGETGLSREDKAAKILADLQADLSGTAVFSLWGIGDYRIEGPLLTCTFIGDGLGHFTVDITIADDTLRLSDRFITDQTCLSSFLAELQKLGE